MYKTLEIYNLPRLNYKEIQNLNRLITNKEMKQVIKKEPPNKRKSRIRWLHWWIIPNIQRRFKIYTFQTLPKNWRQSTSELILWGQHYPDTKTRQGHETHTHKNYRSIFLMNVDANILNKILANQIQQYIERIIQHNQVGFIPGM